MDTVYARCRMRWTLGGCLDFFFAEEVHYPLPDRKKEFENDLNEVDDEREGYEDHVAELGEQVVRANDQACQSAHSTKLPSFTPILACMNFLVGQKSFLVSLCVY